ncbi:Na(+)/dicarboxylate cotransporter 3 [Gastrophryne carolinensis]
MALYWCTEVLPLAVTSLLPIVLFPLLGILPSSKVCPQYLVDTNFLFLSGLIMAAAIEEWNVHRRIALKVLMLVGVKPARLILGMMMTTAFLSMWLSNTAATAMMLPIANAILKSLFGEKFSDEKAEKKNEPGTVVIQEKVLHCVPTELQLLTITEEGSREMPEKVEIVGDSNADLEKDREYQNRIWKAFLISIPYSASIGGTATLTGTAPNLILLGQLKSFFPGCDVVNFGSWFVFAFPLMILFLILSWLWISIFYGAISISCRKKEKSEIQSDREAKAREVITEDYKKLGPTVFAEKAVGFFFALFAILLFTRDPKFIPGWASAFNSGYTSDAVTGITIIIILFFFPSEKPSLSWWFNLKAPNKENKPLLTWQKAQSSVPWNIIILLGGGFAMAKGCEALRLKVNPLYLMIPGTVGCSYAFMLPVSTPPNSIAFSTGHLKVKDMAKTGMLMNLMGVLLLSLAMNTWASALFGLGTIPDWADFKPQQNATLVAGAYNATTGG